MKKKILILKTDIKEHNIMLCPYCYKPVDTVDCLGCCGESFAHMEQGIRTINGEYYLLSEIKIIDNDIFTV